MSSYDLTEKYRKDPTNKVCRFCQRNYPEVSFNMSPHIVPELFGRNKVTSNFECDSCNQEFQKYESDVSTMVQHYLALLNIRTKKGVPTFQSKKESGQQSTVLRSANNNRNFYFGKNLSDFRYNYKKKTITVKFRTRKFSPYSVYKVFLKIGLSLLSEPELSENVHYLRFLTATEPPMNGAQQWTAIRYRLKTKYFAAPSALLYKAKQTLVDQTQYPEFVLIVRFANIAFQLSLPISRKNAEEYNPKNSLDTIIFPFYGWEDIQRLGSVEIEYMDLSETRKVSITDKVIMHYGDIERNNGKNEH